MINVKKRDEKIVPFELDKIKVAIGKPLMLIRRQTY